MTDTCASISRDQSPDVTSPDELNGIKRGSTMVTFSPNKVASLERALTRLSERWDKAIGAAMSREPLTATGMRFTPRMSDDDRRRLWEWFNARYSYLQEQYRRAINERDNIIGKQWLFDQRPKLNKELP